MLFAGEEWAKGDLDWHIRRIYRSYEIGDRMNQEDKTLMIELICLHPHAKEKIGRGVKNIWVRRKGDSLVRYAVIERKDGSFEGLAHMECVRGHIDPLPAFRYATMWHTMEYKKARFAGKSTTKCEISGEDVRWDFCHVDHAYPLTFAQLVFDFLKSEGLRREDVQTYAVEDEARLADDALVARWRAYHEKHAVLRLTDPTVNITEKKVRPHLLLHTREQALCRPRSFQEDCLIAGTSRRAWRPW